MIDTLVIYQHAKYLEYYTIYQTKITQTGDVHWGTNQLAIRQYTSIS